MRVYDITGIVLGYFETTWERIFKDDGDTLFCQVTSETTLLTWALRNSVSLLHSK